MRMIGFQKNPHGTGWYAYYEAQNMDIVIYWKQAHNLDGEWELVSRTSAPEFNKRA